MTCTVHLGGRSDKDRGKSVREQIERCFSRDSGGKTNFAREGNTDRRDTNHNSGYREGSSRDKNSPNRDGNLDINDGHQGIFGRFKYAEIRPNSNLPASKIEADMELRKEMQIKRHQEMIDGKASTIEGPKYYRADIYYNDEFYNKVKNGIIVNGAEINKHMYNIQRQVRHAYWEASTTMHTSPASKHGIKNPIDVAEHEIQCKISNLIRLDRPYKGIEEFTQLAKELRASIETPEWKKELEIKTKAYNRFLEEEVGRYLLEGDPSAKRIMEKFIQEERENRAKEDALKTAKEAEEVAAKEQAVKEAEEKLKAAEEAAKAQAEKDFGELNKHAKQWEKDNAEAKAKANAEGEASRAFASDPEKAEEYFNDVFHQKCIDPIVDIFSGYIEEKAKDKGKETIINKGADLAMKSGHPGIAAMGATVKGAHRLSEMFDWEAEKKVYNDLKNYQCDEAKHPNIHFDIHLKDNIWGDSHG